ncbi:hypothetical protein C8Q77DRAFT_1077827 [Trametes polyzona]|nr:hypothetical protein C8Q77DRAFT_1077827 [Trametes polyzona]
MAIFPFKRSGKSATSTSAMKARVEGKDARAALALQQGPSSPSLPGRAAKQSVVAGASRASHRRPFLLAKGSSAVVDSDDSSDDSASKKVKKGSRKHGSAYALDPRLRYEQRRSFKSGDRVLIKMVDYSRINPRYLWKHGVIADFLTYPPRCEDTYAGLYSWPVTFEVYGSGPGATETTYVLNARCTLLYDKVASAATLA